MAVNLSPIWGAGAQLLDNSGNVLSGGKIYTYAANTTTPAATYTSSTGGTANSNPIILNSAGRVPYEIWMTDGQVYKFVLKDSNDTLIATYDNLVGINSNYVAFTMQQEIQTATAGQTVFDLTTMQYQPGTHSLSVYVDGVNQYGPGAQYAYVETDSDTVTFVSGLHVGASVKFTTATSVSSNYADAAQVTYDPPFTGAVATNVEAKLSETVSVKDFGAVGDGVTDDTAAVELALNSGYDVYFPDGTYLLTDTINVTTTGYQKMYGEQGASLSVMLDTSRDLFVFSGPMSIENFKVDFNNMYCRHGFKYQANVGHIKISNIRFRALKDIDSTTGSITIVIPPTGNTFEIDGIKAYSMLKRGNGTITDTAGSYNMIYIGGGSGSTKGSISNVFVDTVHNINSSDVVIYEDTAIIYVITDSSDVANRVAINNIQGSNFGKRLCKIHASNVTVDNVVGYSTEGDSLGVIGFLSGEGVGDKYGNSASNVRAYGLMETAFSASAYNVKWKNVIASVQPGTKPGMSNGADGILINGNGAEVDGYWSDSERSVAIGSSLQIITNTTLKNITLALTSTSATAIYNSSDTIGFDGILIDGFYATVASTATVTPISLYNFLNGTTIVGKNLVVKNVVVETNGPLNSRGMIVRYITNLSVNAFKYINTSGLSHFRICEIVSCENVNVDDVVIEGTNQIGVSVSNCTGRNTISKVYNPSASTGVVYNTNSSDVTVMNCDTTKVGATTTPAWQNTKQTYGTTAARPTVGREAYFTQYFDTTLGKPIWWTGSNWIDAGGSVV